MGTKTYTYTYGNADWKDLLTAFDGQTISYDASGNPTSYYNGTRWNFTWENGRSLSTASNGTTNISYRYDLPDGLRTGKTVGSVTHSYYYAGGKLLQEIRYFINLILNNGGANDMKIYPIPLIRYCYRYIIIFILVGLPLCLASSCSDRVVYEDRPVFVIMCILLSLVGSILVHIGLWEKCFAHLILSEEKICWKCPFRKTKVIMASQCVEIGAYLENANNGIPTEQIYFSAFPDPQKTIGKNGVMKSSPQLIKFWYSPQLCNYIVQTYSEQQTERLISYRMKRRV